MATTEPMQSPVKNEDKVEDKAESKPAPAELVKENGQEDEPATKTDISATEQQQQQDEKDGVKTEEEEEEVEGQDDEPEDKDESREDAAEKANQEGDESEESSDDEPQVGALDGPVKLMTGKRERKKVERLTFQSPSEKDKEKFAVKDGRGIKLGECPIIEFNIQKTHADVLKPLYRILFYKTGKTNEIKKHIRKFSGFSFTKEDETEMQRKEKQLDRFAMSGLKDMCSVLALEKKGTKEELVNRIIDYLIEPVMIEKKLPVKRKKGSKKSGKKRKPSGKGDAPVKRKRRSKSSEQVEDDDEEDEDEDDDDNDDEVAEEAAEEVDGDEAAEQEDEESAPEDDDGGDDSEFEEPKKKKRKKQQTPKSAKKTKTKTPKKSPTKKSAPKTPKSQKSKAAVDDDDSSDDEAPLAKKSDSPPSESEIKSVITKFLEGANLEQVTMKTVCRMVYDKYPEFDLTPKKDYIKSTVKEIISS